jgi:predicted nucleotidyltransferase
MKQTQYAALVDRLVAVGRADDRIRALLVYGSHARDEADAFSDLDIGIVVADAAYDDFLADREDFVRALGEPLLVEDFGNPTNLHVILADGVDLELIVGRESGLRLDEPFRVLFDRADVVERALRRRVAARPVTPGACEIRRRIEGFWHDVGHLVTALGRGNTWWAYGQLDELRRMCLNLARLEAGAPPEDEAYWKVDEALPPERLASLQGTVAPPEIGPMLTAASAVLDLYRELATALASAHGVPYPADLDRLISDRLRALTAGTRA